MGSNNYLAPPSLSLALLAGDGLRPRTGVPSLTRGLSVAGAVEEGEGDALPGEGLREPLRRSSRRLIQ